MKTKHGCQIEIIKAGRSGTWRPSTDLMWTRQTLGRKLGMPNLEPKLGRNVSSLFLLSPLFLVPSPSFDRPSLLFFRTKSPNFPNVTFGSLGTTPRSLIMIVYKVKNSLISFTYNPSLYIIYYLLIK